MIINFKVVPKQSAITGQPGEILMPVNSCHREMCRFRSKDDADYKALTERLQEAYASRKTTLETAPDCERVPRKEAMMTVSEVPHEEISMDELPNENKIPKHYEGQTTFPLNIQCDAHFKGRDALIKDIQPHLLSGADEGTSWHVGPC